MFYCKSELFERLKALAEKRRAAVVSGANADDTGDFRPGLLAGREMGVRCPLLEAGLTKDEIRRASLAMGLETWDKPAMACLASRIPYGSRISPERLSRIEQAEYVLNDLGFRQCRVRDHGTVARIEVPVSDLDGVLAARERIVESFKALGYAYVTLDLQGFRSGSMNEPLGGPRPEEPRAEHEAREKGDADDA
ncbi:MAG: ATP-dependent sacrificial sulfur transferase LarE [Planctomycetota bacterium]